MNLFLMTIDVCGRCLSEVLYRLFLLWSYGIVVRKKGCERESGRMAWVWTLKTFNSRSLKRMRPESFLGVSPQRRWVAIVFFFTKMVCNPRGPALFEKKYFGDFQDDLTNHEFFIFYFVRNRFLKKVFRPSQAFTAVHSNFSIVLIRPSTFVSTYQSHHISEVIAVGVLSDARTSFFGVAHHTQLCYAVLF